MAGGERGVDRAIDILAKEIRRAKQLLRVRRVDEFAPQHVKLP
jgi:L-lactate dehydrogenase (cytochrome)